MKFLTLQLAFSIGSLFLASTISAQTNLSQGLVLHLPFTGNANDASGNGNNGIVQGATLTSDQNGNPNNAYYFDGINDGIIVPHSSTLNPNYDSGFTITAKINMQGFYNGLCYNNTILSKGFNMSTSSVSYYGLVTTQSLQDDCYFQDTTNHNFRFDFNGNGHALGTQLNATINNTPHVQLNQWDCLVGVFKNDTSYMYVNGVLRYKLKTYAKPYNSDDLSIGFDRWSSMYPFWFRGIIDEIRIYSRALAFAEIDTYCSLKPEEPTTVISQASDRPNISIFPVPFTNQLSIDAPGVEQINIYNLSGQLVYTAKAMHKISIDTNPWAPGTYIVSAISKSGTTHAKIFKN